ncbi:MAG: hypothetical protein ACI4I1_11235 [Oscillospiraceae bacterium]
MMNKTKHKLPSGIGTGYLSIMMIFVVLTLALLAALSLSAAKNEHKYSLKAAEYTSAYYEADLQARQTAVRLKTEADSFFSVTEPEFLAILDAEEGLEYTIVPEGIEISFTTPVNDRQNILMTIRIYDGVCEILSSRTVSAGTEIETDEFTLWNGDF